MHGSPPPLIHLWKGIKTKMRRAVLRFSLLCAQLATQRASISQRETAKRRITLSRAVNTRRGIVSMAPTEPEAYEYIVIGGGSGGSGTVSTLHRH